MRILKLAVVAVLVLAFAAPALAHSDGGVDEAWSEPLNHESYWESRFGGECTKFNNHGGNIPSGYEAVVTKGGNEVRVYGPNLAGLGAFQASGPEFLSGPPANPQHNHRDISWVMKCNIETEQPTEQPVVAEFRCDVLDGIGQASFHFEGRPGADFILNGSSVGGGGVAPAQFGLNTWSASALDGFVLVGVTSGDETIEDCTPATEVTTTTIGETTTTPVVEASTTTAPTETTVTVPTLVVNDPPVVPAAAPTTTTSLVELPFTGADTGPLVLAALAVMGLGWSLLRSARSDG